MKKYVFVFKNLKLLLNYRLKNLLQKNNCGFCFNSQIEFKKFITKNYGFLAFQKFNFLIFEVPNYYCKELVYNFENLDGYGKKILKHVCYKDNKLEFKQTMMEWEKPYMEKCVDYLDPKGDVLEFGFGLGYSASQFLKHNINSYTVIEKDKNIFEKALLWSRKQKNKKIKIINDDWRNFCSSKKFDVFFFDTLESNYSENLLSNIILTHLKENSVYGGYAVSNENPNQFRFKNNFKLEKTKIFYITIPKNVIYISKGQKIYLIKYKKINKNIKYF